MEKMSKGTIGIDISKDTLDVYRSDDGAAKRFTNDRNGHSALLRWLGKGTVKRLVHEATGPYTRPFEHAMDAAGMPLVKVNPRQARRFAEAAGTLAKTDRVDAAMLARMGAALDLPARPPASETTASLKELLLKDRTAARNRAKILTIPLLKRQNAERLKRIDSHLADIDGAIAQTIAKDPILARRLAILETIPGIAAVTAQAMIIDMPELGLLDGKKTASLAGLAPMTRQSGKWTGKAKIRGGRANLRQALYMPALVACRFNPHLKDKYDQLRAAGKPKKVAITAIMRKLIVLANALIRDNRKWTPNNP